MSALNQLPEPVAIGGDLHRSVMLSTDEANRWADALEKLIEAAYQGKPGSMYEQRNISDLHGKLLPLLTLLYTAGNRT